MVGIYLLGSSDDNEKIPDWLTKGTLPAKQYAVVGCEVKHRISTPGNLYLAIREARHNCRYFDEGWLIGEIADGLLEYARELGLEYNIGIIQLDAESVVNSQVISMPAQRTDRPRLGVFLGRVDGVASKLEGVQKTPPRCQCG